MVSIKWELDGAARQPPRRLDKKCTDLLWQTVLAYEVVGGQKKHRPRHARQGQSGSYCGMRRSGGSCRSVRLPLSIS